MATDAAITGATLGKDQEALVLQVRRTGSSWAAFALCVQLRPLSVGELFKVIGDTMGPKIRERAFDACADAFVVFDDARTHGAL